VLLLVVLVVFEVLVVVGLFVLVPVLVLVLVLLVTEIPPPVSPKKRHWVGLWSCIFRRYSIGKLL
jgi:hypothetical protein